MFVVAGTEEVVRMCEVDTVEDEEVFVVIVEVVTFALAGAVVWDVEAVTAGVVALRAVVQEGAEEDRDEFADTSVDVEEMAEEDVAGKAEVIVEESAGEVVEVSAEGFVCRAGSEGQLGSRSRQTKD